MVGHHRCRRVVDQRTVRLARGDVDDEMAFVVGVPRAVLADEELVELAIEEDHSWSVNALGLLGLHQLKSYKLAALDGHIRRVILLHDQVLQVLWGNLSRGMVQFDTDHHVLLVAVQRLRVGDAVKRVAGKPPVYKGEVQNVRRVVLLVGRKLVPKVFFDEGLTVVHLARNQSFQIFEKQVVFW